MLAIMSCSAGIAGCCFGLAFFKKDISKLIPLILIFVLIFGMAIVSFAHMSEINNTRGSATTQYSPYICFIEDTATCGSITNQITNISYSDYTSGKSLSFTYSIPISLIDKMKSNIGTFFIFGLLIAWGVKFGGARIGKKE